MEQVGESKKKAGFGRLFLFVLIALGLMTAILFNMLIANTKVVTINDEGNIIEVKTLATTVQEVLKQQDIELGEADEVHPQLHAKLNKKETITIQRAVPVSVMVDGKKLDLMTCRETVNELLRQANVLLNEKDIVNYKLSDPITAEMEVKVTRVVEKAETITEQIDFQTIKRPNEKMDSGKTKVVQQGIQGERQKEYMVVLHDGNEVSRKLVNDEVVKQPVDHIIEYGTIATHKTSRGETFRYKKVLNMRATAYDLSYESCGKNPDHPEYGITFTGMKARYGVVAVDPKTIPLYSRLYIEAADGSWAYGFAVAGDIGSAVKGDIIDLFYDDEEFVRKFGCKRVKVYILE